MKLIFLILILTISACKKKSSDECTTDCIDQQTPTIRNVKLKIKFKDTHFYNREDKKFRTISAEDIAEGNLGERVPVYADFLSVTSSESLGKVAVSQIQKDSPDAFLEDDLNSIPYIAAESDSGVSIIYQYKKLNTTGNEVASATGEFIINGSTAYLPFINEMFDDKFFSATSGGSQTNYTHVLQIAAQSANSSESESYTITFNSSLIVPNKDFQAEYSSDMVAIDLKDRFNYFYDGSDGTPNTELLLGKMIEKADLSSVNPVDLKDIRVLFKTKPKIEMVYTVFDENPLYKESNNADANITVLRGYEFYEKSYSLTSDRDFGLIFKINDTDTALTSGDKEGIIRDVSAGVNWNLTFGYDLTQALTYPAGKQLLKPLRPICNTITKTPYTPLTTQNWRDTITGLAGFAAICHPDTYKAESSNAADLATFAYDQVDTWYDYFSYMSEKDVSSNIQHKRVRPGHLYGIKSIQFKIEGCMKLYSRDASLLPTNPNPWIQKNNETEGCSSGGDTGWTDFSLNKEISIFDNVDQYTSTPGLKELINNYRNSVPVNSVNFSFNNDIFFEHIF